MIYRKLSVVGYKTQFYNPPVQGSYSKEAHFLRVTRFANQEIQKILKDAIKSVSISRGVSLQCLVRKKVLGHRLVLNLKKFDQFIPDQHFNPLAPNAPLLYPMKTSG